MAINHGENKWAIYLTGWVCPWKLQMFWLTYECGWVLVSGENRKTKNAQSGMGVCVCDTMVPPADTGLGAVLWLPGVLMKCTACTLGVVVKIKGRWVKLIWRFTANPGRAFLLKLLSCLPWPPWHQQFAGLFESPAKKGNTVICTPGARMGAFKHLMCTQRILMHPALWLL